jgi:uncharacterized protein (UPF0276 family)
MFKIQKPALTNSVGVGLRHPHHDYVLANNPDAPWLEVHSENFFAKGGPSLNFIKKIREKYPLSLHGVGLSLGSAQKIDETHLKKLKTLVDFIDPFLVSDHVSWSNIKERVLNDLLPIPYIKESLDALCSNISQVQDYLGRQILVENPSTYLGFNLSTMPEDEFINEVARITGCKILLDINNIYVSSQNNNFDAVSYINTIKADIVGEMHLAGHTRSQVNGEIVLIDTHDDYICDEVWDLYKVAVKKFNVPSLIEWDDNLPSFNDLLSEAKKAQIIISENEAELSKTKKMKC